MKIVKSYLYSCIIVLCAQEVSAKTTDIVTNYFTSLFAVTYFYADYNLIYQEYPSSLNQEDTEFSNDDIQALDLAYARTLNLSVYKELKEESINTLIKVNTKTPVEVFAKLSPQKRYIVSKIANSYNNNDMPLIFQEFSPYYLDYLTWAYGLYSFTIIKESAEDYFIKGTLKTPTSGLFQEIRVRVRKDYNIPTKMTFIQPNGKNIEMEVLAAEKVGDRYYASKYIYNFPNGSSITVELSNISIGLSLEVKNNFKISLAEYLQYLDYANNK